MHGSEQWSILYVCYVSSFSARSVLSRRLEGHLVSPQVAAAVVASPLLLPVVDFCWCLWSLGGVSLLSRLYSLGVGCLEGPKDRRALQTRRGKKTQRNVFD